MAITWNGFQNITGSALTFKVLRTNRIKNISSHLFPIFVLLRWSRQRILVHSKAAQCILSLRIYRIMDLSIFAVSLIHLFRCFTLITTCFTCSNISLGSSSNEKLKKCKFIVWNQVQIFSLLKLLWNNKGTSLTWPQNRLPVPGPIIFRLLTMGNYE